MIITGKVIKMPDLSAIKANENETEIGVGYSSGSYWDQMFIGK